MTKNEAAVIVGALRGASRILIASHVNPDGDAVGSVLGLASLARSLGVASVVACLPDSVPRVYNWLPGADSIVGPEAIRGSFDLVLIADANSLERIGAVAASIPEGTAVAIVDHHLTEERNGTFHLIDSSYAATGEIVADLFDAAEVPLDRDTAECIYVALSTDTGNFRYANTTSRSHRIAARLIDLGINVREITSRVIDTMTVGKFHLLRRLLDRAEMGADGRIAHGFITEDDLRELQALPEDVDGLINYLRNLEGVELAILFRQSEPQLTKVSFRSQPAINSAEIAQFFGGGGHAMAAGASLPWPLDEAREHLFQYLRDTLRVDL